MPDYQRGIQNGTMMIRDTGGVVEFWFKTGSATYNNQQTWGYQANGQYIQQDFRLERGGNWQRFGAVQVDSDQNVMFRILGEGLGWPTTDFTVFIERVTIPPPPRPPTIWRIASNEVDVGWGGDGGAGGASITSREIWFSFDGTPRYLGSGDGSRQTVRGLSPGTAYNFWARNANAKGMSAFGAPALIRTLRVPDAPNPVFFDKATQRSVFAKFTFDGKWDGGSPIREWQIGYGLNLGAPTAFHSHFEATLANLQPSRVYYFWSRARNDIGWGPWSARTEITLPAGAWVKVNGEWRRALPWMKVNGVWKVVEPKLLVLGTWKGSS